jgi:hypothetical protein
MQQCIMHTSPPPPPSPPSPPLTFIWCDTSKALLLVHLASLLEAGCWGIVFGLIAAGAVRAPVGLKHQGGQCNV